MFRHLIYRLGQDPAASWGKFKIGLILFVLAAGLILAGSQYWVLLQIPGLMLLPVAVFYAASGYLGIFANRFAQTLNQVKPDVFEDKKNTPPD